MQTQKTDREYSFRRPFNFLIALSLLFFPLLPFPELGLMICAALCLEEAPFDSQQEKENSPKKASSVKKLKCCLKVCGYISPLNILDKLRLLHEVERSKHCQRAQS